MAADPHDPQRSLPSDGRQPLGIDPEGESTATATAVIGGVASTLMVIGLTMQRQWIWLLVVLGIGAVIASRTHHRVRSHLAWTRPTLQLEAAPLHLGDDASFTYEHRAKRPIDVSSDSHLHIALVCTESTRDTSGSGDDKTTTRSSSEVSRTVGRFPVEATPSGLRARGRIAVPLDAGGPSLEAPNNAIRWHIRTRLEGPSLPFGSEEFPVPVVGVLAVSHRAVQDTRPVTAELGANPMVTVDDTVCELGSQLRGTILFRPEEDDRTRTIRINLRWKTRGRGDTDRGFVSSADVPVRFDGTIDRTWRLPIPDDAPISYEGETVAIRYTLTARVDRAMRIDHESETAIVVLPRHGRSAYRTGPHPFR